jgi:protein-tyrosine kinase
MTTNLQNLLAEKQKNSPKNMDSRILSQESANSKCGEEFKLLRTNIKTYFLKQKINQLNEDSSLSDLNSTKIITLTSASYLEEKTLTAANLASVLSMDINSNVLFIDADLRKTGIHDLFSGPDSPGLSDILCDKISFFETIQPTKLERLFYIPHGKETSTPSEILGSKNMQHLLQAIKKEHFSYVIVDAPPVLSYTDAGILGAITEGIVFVVQSEKTKSTDIKKSLSLLKHAYANIIGFVYNSAASISY